MTMTGTASGVLGSGRGHCGQRPGEGLGGSRQLPSRLGSYGAPGKKPQGSSTQVTVLRLRLRAAYTGKHYYTGIE